MIDFLKGIPKDLKDNIKLNDVMYHRGNRENDYTDALDIIFTDVRNGQKYLRTIEKPEIDIYFVKKELQDFDYNKNYIPIKDTYMKRVRYKNVIYEIAKEAGSDYQNFLKECDQSGNYNRKKNIHFYYKYVFGSDLEIEPLYRIYWQLQYNNDKSYNPSLLFSDIEVDIKDIKGFPKNGNCPIILDSIFDRETKTMYTLCLRNKDNPLIQEFEDNIDDFVTDLHKDFDESYGSDLQYKILMYDKEEDLIRDIFNIINTLKRDYCLWWNGYGFDLEFIMDRMEVLNMDLLDTVCHKDFKYKECYLYKDRNNFVIANKGDYFKISAYTQHIDQMYKYASIRKGQGTLRSNKLTDTAMEEIKDAKLDYSDSSSLRDLPYTDYALYVKYNIKDVLLQYGIEEKTHDMDTLYSRSILNVTPIEKCFKQTRFLENRAYMEYLLSGLVIGNNCNIDHGMKQSSEPKSKDKVRFAGALVGNPENNGYYGSYIFGLRSKYVFQWVIDMDFSSMYPNILYTFNIAPNTLIGKLFVSETAKDLVKKLNVIYDSNDEEIDNEDEETGEYGLEATLVEDKGKDFIEDYLSLNIPNTGKIWFNLPSTEEVYNRFKNKYRGKGIA